MKKVYLILIILLLFLTSCKQDSIEVKNMTLINGVYSLKVDKEKSNINLKDYITSNIIYQVKYEDQTFSSDNDNLVFNLKDGFNDFKIISKNQTIKISVYKAYLVKLTLVNDAFEPVTSFDVFANEKVSKDLFKEFIPKGYLWNSDLVYYSFDNFSFKTISVNDLKVTQDLYLRLDLKSKSYEITLIDGINETKINISSGDVLTLPVLFKKGYTFMGWYKGNTLIENNIKYDESLGTTFVAKFVKNKYIITYQFFDEEKTQEVMYGDEFKLFTPTIKGYKFNGWTLNNATFNDTTYLFDTDITLVGSFTANTYKIIYQGLDQEQIQNVTFGKEFTLFEPVKDGYQFLGWYYNDQKFSSGIWNFDHNINLQVKWKKVSVDVNLESFGGIMETKPTIDSNGYLVLPTPYLEGYKFVGWYLDKRLTTLCSSILASEYKGEKLYAKYTLDNNYLTDEIIFTRYNSHAEQYDEVALFKKGVNPMATLYWHKIGIKFANGNYFVSSIATSGNALKEVGDYDYLLLAYASSPDYSKFVDLNIMPGTIVKFLIDPTSTPDGATINMVSFLEQNVDDFKDEIVAHLDNLYGNYVTVNFNLDLITNYKQFVINWESSNSRTISPTGIYHAPNKTQKVTLTAFIQSTKIYSFTVTVEGINKTGKALATGYIYTPYNITQNAMDTLDIIYCAFFEVNSNADWTNLERMKNNLTTYILPKAKLSGTKVVISVNQNKGGAFSNIAGSLTLREKLANNILQVVTELGLDGVDIDWETPSSNEKTNFTLLMKDIYNTMKKANSEYLVTAAIGGGMWQPPKYDLPNSIKYLDYVNLMTYSLATGNGYYQNALYKSTKGATLASCSIDESIKIHNDLGVPNEKILLGIPFYLTVQTESNGPGSGKGSGRSVWYSALYDKYKLSDTMKEYFDEECGVPYRYDDVNKIFISYDNERSIKVKCEYINTVGLAGIMYWQYGQDVDDYLSNAIRKYINA